MHLTMCGSRWMLRGCLRRKPPQERRKISDSISLRRAWRNDYEPRCSSLRRGGEAPVGGDRFLRGDVTPRRGSLNARVRFALWRPIRIIGRRRVRILEAQKFDAGHRGVIRENLPQKPIDLGRIVARKIPRHAYLAGGGVHHQSPGLGEEFENLLQGLTRGRIDLPNMLTGEQDLPRPVSCGLAHEGQYPLTIM